LDLAAFRELEAFAQLGTELDPATQSQLDRGYRLVELLKQQQYQPLPVTEQVISIFAATRGYMDDVEVENVSDFEAKMLEFFRDRKSDVLSQLGEAADLTDEVEKAVRSAIEEFKQGYRPG
jgi:F-type H+-transporting ATPase subunit alpha